MTTSTPSSKLADVDVDVGGREQLCALLGYVFTNPHLMELALRHRSFCSEHPGLESNERLEFLGDAILSLVIAEASYERFPDLPEGQLAQIRSAVVNTKVLAEIATGIDLGASLALGRGEEASGGRAKMSILADSFEALLGAVYLDGGYAPSARVILSLLSERLDHAAAVPEDFDHKSRLQEQAVALGENLPRYVVEGSGPDHARHYCAEVFVGDRLVGSGEGTSKKLAEQDAARNALEAIGTGPVGDQGGHDA